MARRSIFRYGNLIIPFSQAGSKGVEHTNTEFWMYLGQDPKTCALVPFPHYKGKQLLEWRLFANVNCVVALRECSSKEMKKKNIPLGMPKPLGTPRVTLWIPALGKTRRRHGGEGPDLLLQGMSWAIFWTLRHSNIEYHPWKSSFDQRQQSSHQRLRNITIGGKEKKITLTSFKKKTKVQCVLLMNNNTCKMA